MRTVTPQHGFTLTEMAVTVAVLAILAAIAAPSFQETLNKRRLIGAAEQLYADLQYARSEAAKRNAYVVVTFTGTGSTWCYGISTASCSCTATSGPSLCQLDGVTKVVDQQGFKNVSLTGNTFPGGATAFEPQRGIARLPSNAIAFGTATFTVNAGASNARTSEVVVSSFGRVIICSPSSARLAEYPAC